MTNTKAILDSVNRIGAKWQHPQPPTHLRLKPDHFYSFQAAHRRKHGDKPLRCKIKLGSGFSAIVAVEQSGRETSSLIVRA